MNQAWDIVALCLLGTLAIGVYANRFVSNFSDFGSVAGMATLIVGLTGFIVVPLRTMGVMTIPEYYEKHFGWESTILATCPVPTAWRYQGARD